MCPLDEESGICMCVVPGLHQYCSSSMSGMYYDLENVHTYSPPLWDPQRKEIAVGTQFISSRPPAKCWQTTPGHNPHVVNHNFTSLGSMWF